MKKLVVSMMLGTMIVSSATMSFASAKPVEKIALAELTAISSGLSENELENINMTDLEDCMVIDMTDVTFTDFMGDLLKEVTATDKDMLEKHYNQAVKYEKEEKYETADKEWSEFDKIFFKYETSAYGDIEMPSFDAFMEEMKEFLKTMDSKDEKNLKGLYEAAAKLDKEEKYDDSMKAWDAFYKGFDKFIDESKLETCETSDLEEADYEDQDLMMEMPTYKAFIKDMSEFLKPISTKDQKSLETLYNKAIANDKEGKYEEAEKDWTAFDQLLEGYLKANVLPETINEQ